MSSSLYPDIIRVANVEMVASQLRSASVARYACKHVKAARSFSTSSALRKEIQDAYILSAARTPTAKVSLSCWFCRFLC